VVAEEEQIHFP
jgi:hypothetical protein